jgi:hypothetical protein
MRLSALRSVLCVITARADSVFLTGNTSTNVYNASWPQDLVVSISLDRGAINYRVPEGDSRAGTLIFLFGKSDVDGGKTVQD